MATTMIERGARVRFTSSLGTLAHRNAGRMEDHAVSEGDQGEYDSPHPTLDGWHFATVQHEGETLYVPVHPAHFEVLA